MGDMKKTGLAVAVIAAVIIGATMIISMDSETTPVETQTITDMQGREVEVPKDVNSLVCIYPMATGIVYSIGGQESLVGVDTNSRKNEMLQKIDPAITDKADAGMPGDFNIEHLLTLDPDVVLARSVDDIEYVLTSLSLVLTDFDDVKDAASLIGRVLDREEKADMLSDYIDNKIEMIEQRTSNILENEKPRVQFTGPMDRYSSAIGGEFQDGTIKMAGGINVAGDESGDRWFGFFDPEDILYWNPEVIILPAYCGDSADDVLNDPELQDVSAVKEGRVYNMPRFTESWDTPVPEGVLGLIWMAQLFHPEEFEDIDMAQEIRDFSNTFYEYNPTDEEIDRILNDPRSI